MIDQDNKFLDIIKMSARAAAYGQAQAMVLDLIVKRTEQKNYDNADLFRMRCRLNQRMNNAYRRLDALHRQYEELKKK
jgi:hypothetical protein